MITARGRRDNDPARRLKVPHVGWNALDFRSRTARSSETGARLLEGLSSGAQVYFTHSYAAPITAECVASTEHANAFSSVVERVPLSDGVNDENQRYLATKRDKLGHIFPEELR